MGSLKNAGFVMLSLPQSDVNPLQLLIRTSSGTVDRLNASLGDLFIPQTTAPPDVSSDKPLPEVEGEEELNMNINADVSFLKGLEKFFGLKGSANFSYEQGRIFKIKLNDPKLSTVNVIRLSGFIKDAKVNNSVGDMADKLNDSEVYVITEVIKAKSFRVGRANNQQAKEEIEVNVPGVAEGSQGVDIGRKDSSDLHYDGDTPMTFALKAYRIKASGGGWFSGDVKYTIESAKDVEHVREGNFYGEPLESPGSKYLNLNSDE
jgi:hypothetical protein